MLIDGHDLRDVSIRSLRDQLAIVPQEGHLFAGTIAENLAFGRPEASRRRAARRRRRRRRHRVHRGAARRLRHPHQRARLRPVGGPAPAHLLRARAGRRPAPADPRRGHLLGRPPRRAAHRRGPAHPAGRPHRHRHRPPPLDDPRRRPHRGARGRPRSWSRAATTSCWPPAAATRSCTATGRPPRPREALEAPRGTFGTIVRARPVVGDRLAVGRRVLAPVAGVRILLPQLPPLRRAVNTAHSSRGLGRRPLTAVTRVQIPYALLTDSHEGACRRRPFSCSWPVATKRQKLTRVAVLDQNWTKNGPSRAKPAIRVTALRRVSRGPRRGARAPSPRRPSRRRRRARSAPSPAPARSARGARPRRAR